MVSIHTKVKGMVKLNKFNMKTIWLKQYLEDENLHYLTELHEEDGILGEYFFYTAKELNDYVKENKIIFNRELYGELKTMGLTNDHCHLVLEWVDSLPIQVVGSNITATIEEGVFKAWNNTEESIH